MKTIQILCIALLTLWGCSAPTNPEVEAVKAVINKSYVEGIHNQGSLDDIKAGFDPGFEMLFVREGELTKFSIGEWIERIENSRRESPNQMSSRVDVKFLEVNVTGEAASARFELIKEGKTIFTDYMFLLKINDEWKIVSKVYHRH